MSILWVLTWNWIQNGSDIQNQTQELLREIVQGHNKKGGIEYKSKVEKENTMNSHQLKGN